MPKVVNPNAVDQSLPGKIKKVARDVSDTKGASIPQLTALITDLVVPQVGSANNASFTLTTVYQTLSSFNFTVPTGCTRVLLTVSGHVGGSSVSTTGDWMNVQCVVNGTGGPESVHAMSTSTAFGSVASFQSVSLTGLTAGSTIPVLIQAHLHVGPGTTAFPQSSLIVGQALFLP